MLFRASAFKRRHIGTEIARGVVNRDQKRETTILPQPWGMAAMFDDALMEQLGDMAGDETRITHDMEERPSSLELFGPTIDMERDPRWGRGQETYSEDPYLTAQLGVAYIKGLQGDGKYLKVAACASTMLCTAARRPFATNLTRGEPKGFVGDVSARV